VNFLAIYCSVLYKSTLFTFKYTFNLVSMTVFLLRIDYIWFLGPLFVLIKRVIWAILIYQS